VVQANLPLEILEMPRRHQHLRPMTATFASAAPHAFADPRARVELLATLLDSAVRIPGTRITFGADALLNLVPGLGTVVAQALSAWILVEARRLGVPAPVLLRMLANLGFDTLVSAVPVLGWVGDVFFRANRRNVDLIRRHLAATSSR
jgi:hypothetical protein